MKKLILATIVFSSLTSAQGAFAQGFKGFYFGAGVGSTNYSDDGYTEDMQKSLSVVSGYSSTTTSYDADGQTYKLIAGYMFNRIIGLEAQYTDYAPIKVNSSLSAFNHELDLSSFTLNTNVGYTFDNGLRPFVTAGLGSIDLDESGSEAGATIRIGAGVEYFVPQLSGLSIRAAYEVDSFVLDFYGKEYNQAIGSFYASASYNF
ncbi:outer membrane beta-barrel protein [Vibrio sp. T11.5]|uniref:outer membrane beta-barrel protein n=1 Tax=Vibrio sp. T11.5 TaxID=2998836 RepID=UPI0022CD9F52|nr:outer membrane beta-barrel protein [Vibrio sp. T11.5]MDA0118888.1 outer membrane beta-barrel protein [Vibrio sp. T11.5]